MIISPDAQEQIDGSLTKHIIAHLPSLPIDIVPITWIPSFQFNPPRTNRYVLLNYMESHSPMEEYDKLWAWVRDNPPILEFRRDLEKREVSPVLKPCEFAGYLDIPPTETREQFDSRPIDTLFFWGFSHVSRPRLHAKIFEGILDHGLNVISDWDMWEGLPNKSKVWMSVFTPHWKRKPMVEIRDEFMSKAKVTVSLYGNGRKSFRSAECVGTIMALPKDEMAWSYDWNESNSIQLPSDPEQMMIALVEASKRADLHALYLACDENMRKYYAPEYVSNYIVPEIEKIL